VTNILRLAIPDRSPDWIDLPVHRQISTDDLMAGESVIVIRHGAEEYRLRLTPTGKLILTP
jgi:hemin uptake protein HemP